MKKVFIAVFVLSSALTFAQSAKVVSAYNYNQKGQLDQAWSNIEEATKDEKTGMDPKTWKYRFDILMNIMQAMQDPKAPIENKTVVKASELEAKLKESYEKTKELDTKKKYIGDLNAMLVTIAQKSGGMAGMFYNSAGAIDKFKTDDINRFIGEDGKTDAAGVTANLENLKSKSAKMIGDKETMPAKDDVNKCLDGDKAEVGNCLDGKIKEKYTLATAMFAQSYSTFQLMGVTDSSSVYNAAIAAQKAGLKKEAAELFEEVGKINYGGALVYSLSARLQKELGNSEKQVNIIKQGRKNYPEDLGLLTDELNIYLADGNLVESEKLLKLAIEKSPNNENMFFVLGSTYDNLANPVKDGKELPKPANYTELVGKAQESYKRAIELKGDYFDALYNYGALLFNDGAEYINKANALDYRTKKAQIDELNKKAEGKFKEAIPVFEKARTLQPNDRAVLTSLKQLYVRLEMTDKMEEVNKKLKELK